MPRFPVASFESYEEPVAASETAASTPQSSKRRSHKTAAKPSTSSSMEDKNGEPTTSPRRDLQEKNVNRADDSEGSLKLSRAQRAEEYPQLAFKPRREIRQGGAEGSTQERHTGPSNRTHDYIFGLGSHGLGDRSPVRITAPDDDSDAEAATTSGYPALPGATRTAAKNAKATMNGQKKDTSGILRLPPIGPTSTTSGPSVFTAGRSTKAHVPSSLPPPNAPRVLRCGGVIDTFSYFSVHRVHPELYAN